MPLDPSTLPLSAAITVSVVSVLAIGSESALVLLLYSGGTAVVRTPPQR